jgi:hypothetical protein
LVVSGLLLATVFSGATVKAYPRTAEAPVQGKFVISAEEVPGLLSYDFMIIEQTEVRVVPATESREVEEYAQGKITIFNNYDENSQRLIKNTRFESTEGKIYRIRESVDVPGKSGDTPGQIEVTVYADEPGESYNVGLTAFTIPGFQGTPRFDAFSAESVSPISGGFVGERRTVDEEELATIRTELQESLRTKLSEEALTPSRKPEGVHLYPDAILYEFEELPSANTEDGGIEIREKGVAKIALFGEEDFAEYLAGQVIAGYEGEAIELLNPQDLSISIRPLPEEAREEIPWDGEALELSVNGEARFAWTFNESQLANDLAGRHQDARHTIFRGYPAVSREETTIRPFWKNAFPEDPADIKIEKIIEE